MKRVRVIHVVNSMNRGGVETWLMHVLRSIDRERFQMDFVVFADWHGDYDAEILELGSSILHCSGPSHPMRLARDFASILREHGPYDVVHSHDATYNGPVLGVAERSGVPIRIAHSHNDIRQSIPQNLVKNLYTRWSVGRSRRLATHGLACSELAAEAYFGRKWRADPRWNVFFCGEDFSPFAESVDACAVRESLGLPADAVVVGHTGSFRRAKNHSFIVEIATQLSKADDRIHFLLIGDGVIRPEIERAVTDAGLERKVIFTGVRSDVPRLMLGAMDLFLFPSVSEGLGLALVEAQAAGLPCVCSDCIPREADVVSGLVTRLSLTHSPVDWARTVMAVLRVARPVPHKDALGAVNNSRFSLSNSLGILEALYCGERNSSGVHLEEKHNK